MKINFSRWVGGFSSYLVEIPEGGGGGGGGVICSLQYRKPGRWGVLSEIPSVAGYGYFLEPHNMKSVC